MSNRSNDRLHLNREVVRELTPRDLGGAAGGADSSEVCAIVFGQVTSELSRLNHCVTNVRGCLTYSCITAA